MRAGRASPAELPRIGAADADICPGRECWIEEMMEERGVAVDHTTVHRWALKLLPVLAAVFRKKKINTSSQSFPHDKTRRGRRCEQLAIMCLQRTFRSGDISR